MHVHKRLFAALIVFWLATPCFLVAQNEPANDILDRLKDLSRKSKTVETATGYTEIIRECDTLLGMELAKESHRKYVQSLLSWGLDNRAVLRSELADEFRNIGSDEQAKLVLKQAFDDFVRSLENEERWQTYKHRGTLLAQLDRFEEAIEDFSSVIRLHPESTSAWFNRAELHAQLNQHEKALPDYNHVLKENPQDLQSISGRAHCHLAMDNAAGALKDYDTVVNQLPDDSWALANRADAYVALGQWQEACNDLERANKTSTNGELCRRLSWLLATCPDESICDGARALEMARKAVKITGESIDNLDALAAAYAAAGEFDRARDVHSRVIALQETNDPSTAVKQAAYENNERYQEKFER